jgi:hypothetical protein
MTVQDNTSSPKIQFVVTLGMVLHLDETFETDINKAMTDLENRRSTLDGEVI